MRWLLLILTLLSTRSVFADPVWTRQLPGPDGAETYAAVENDQIVLRARIFRDSSAAVPRCPLNVSTQDAHVNLDTVFVTNPDYDRDHLCFTDGSTAILIDNVAAKPGLARSIRAFLNTALTLSPDTAPPLPAGWTHDPAARDVISHSNGDHVTRAYLFDAASAPPCASVTQPGAPPPQPGADVGCTRGDEVIVRATRGSMILDMVVDDDGGQLLNDLDVWFHALHADTQVARALVLVPRPADVAATATPDTAVPPPAPAYTPAVYSSSHHGFGVGGLGHGMPAGHHEFLARYNWVSMPIDLEYLGADEPNHVAWYGEQVWGGTIVEHGPGIISRINAVFLAGAGAQWYQNTNTGEVWHENNDVALGQEASWTVDAGSKYWGFRADSWWFRWFGWRFGGWHVTELNSDERASNSMPGPTADLLSRYGAFRVNSNYGIEIEFMMRYQKWLPLLGLLSASIDLPVPYLCGIAFFRDDRGMLYAWGGVPRIQADIARRVGPLMFHVNASSPTGWLVMPLKSGQQLTLSGGVTF